MNKLKKPNPSEMCPPGYHIVRGHERTCHSGTVTWVTDHWRSEGLKFPGDLDPLMVKALISVESDFDPNAESTDPDSTAAGLMQVTDQSLRVLGGFPNKKKWIEARKHLIHVTKQDKFDPVVSVALGTRLLAHKFSQIPKRYSKNAKGMMIGYHSFDKAGEKYVEKVLSRYEAAKKKK